MKFEARYGGYVAVEENYGDVRVSLVTSSGRSEEDAFIQLSSAIELHRELTRIIRELKG